MYEAGDKIKFKGEKQRYTVQVSSPRWLICTKPFNLKNTVLYTIVDLKEGVRGTNNMIFNPYDYASLKDMEKCMRDLISGRVEISYRNRVKLEIEDEGHRS